MYRNIFYFVLIVLLGIGAFFAYLKLINVFDLNNFNNANLKCLYRLDAITVENAQALKKFESRLSKYNFEVAKELINFNSDSSSKFKIETDKCSDFTSDFEEIINIYERKGIEENLNQFLNDLAIEQSKIRKSLNEKIEKLKNNKSYER